MIKNILIGIGVLIAVSVITKPIFILSLNTSKGNKEEVLSVSGQPLKKGLIVYQPGVTAISSRIAHQIAKGLNDGGCEVTLHYPGDYLSADVSKYSFLVFGSPVYGEQPSKVLTDYMSKIMDYSSQKIVLYTTGSVKNTMGFSGLDTMEQFLNGKKAYKKIKFFTNAQKENDTVAYDLGNELTKSSF